MSPWDTRILELAEMLGMRANAKTIAGALRRNGHPGVSEAVVQTALKRLKREGLIKPDPEKERREYEFLGRRLANSPRPGRPRKAQ